MDGQFIGFYATTDTVKAEVIVRNSSDVPVQADSTPTYRIYGPSSSTPLDSGSLSSKDTGSVTGATNASPIVIASTGHGLQTGMRVTVASVGGNTAANGTFTITRVNDNSFSLDGSTGNGAYTSGGTWLVTGLYEVSKALDSDYTAGKFYTIVTNAIVSSNQQNAVLTFGVV